MKKVISFVLSALMTCVVCMHLILGFFWPNGFYYTGFILGIVAAVTAVVWVLGLILHVNEESEKLSVIGIITAVLFALLLISDLVMGLFYIKGFYYTYRVLAFISLLVVLLWLLDLILSLIITEGIKPKAKTKTRSKAKAKANNKRRRYKDLSGYKTDELKTLAAEAAACGDEESRRMIYDEYRRRLDIENSVNDDFEKISEENKKERAAMAELLRKYDPTAHDDDEVPPVEDSSADENTDELEEIVLPPMTENNEDEELDEYSKRLSALFSAPEEADESATE